MVWRANKIGVGKKKIKLKRESSRLKGKENKVLKFKKDKIEDKKRQNGK